MSDFQKSFVYQSYIKPYEDLQKQCKSEFGTVFPHLSRGGLEETMQIKRQERQQQGKEKQK